MQRHLEPQVKRLKAARTAAAIVAVASLLGLAGLGIAANAGGGVLGVAQPVLASPSTTAPPTTAPPSTLPPRPVVAVTAPAATAGSPRPVAVAPTTTATTQPPAAPPTSLVPPPPVPPPLDTPPRPCALGLPTPEHTGGVAALVDLVPLFGPFTAEAFALQPAWGPFLNDIGPLVALGATALDKAKPLLDALTPALQGLEQAGFDLLAPLYLPFRQDFLDAQADLAAALAPITQAISTAPGTECLIALQGLLTDPLVDALGG